MIVYAVLDQPVRIGAAGDNKAISVRFDITDQRTEWPSGQAVLYVHQGAYVYLNEVSIVSANNRYYAQWEITSLHSLLARYGEAMIHYTYDSEGWEAIANIINSDASLKNFIQTNTASVITAASNDSTHTHYTKLNQIVDANPKPTEYSTRLALFTFVKSAVDNPVLWSIYISQSPIYQFVVDDSLEINSDTPTHPDQGLITTLTEIMNRAGAYAATASSAATSATNSASAASTSEANAAISATSASDSATTATAAASTATTQAENATVAASHYPYIGSNNDWFVWDVSASVWSDTGISAHGTTGTAASITATDYVGDTQGITPPTQGWQSTIPSVAAGAYLWVRHTWNNLACTYYSARQGADGSGGGGGGGTVTSITAGTGLTGGTITTSGTIAADTTVLATRAWVTETVLDALDDAY